MQASKRTGGKDLGLLMLVKSHDRYAVLGVFDPQSGRLDEIPRIDPVTGQDRTTADLICGHFTIVAETVVVFYRYNGYLWLRLGRDARQLEPGPSPFRYSRVHDRARMSLVDGAREVVSVEYTAGPESGPPLSKDMTPFVETEDWDFGLFVHNRLRSKARRERMYQPISD